MSFLEYLTTKNLPKKLLLKVANECMNGIKTKKTCALEPTDVTNEYRLITVEHYDFGDTTYKGEYFLLEELELNRAYF